MEDRDNKTYRITINSAWAYMIPLKNVEGVYVKATDISAVERIVTNTVTGEFTTDPLNPTDVFFDPPKIAPDDCGCGEPFEYNFRDSLPANKITERITYRLQYKFTPTVGDVFRSKEVDVLGD